MLDKMTACSPFLSAVTTRVGRGIVKPVEVTLGVVRFTSATIQKKTEFEELMV